MSDTEDGYSDGYGYAEGGTDGEYAAAAYPGERWDTAPVIEHALEEAWEAIEETATEVWEWATEDSPAEELPYDTSPYEGQQGGEGAPPYYPDEGSQGGGGAPAY
jgi:hypothetical protein